jgi:type I restriction enzyme, S subunit
MKTDIIYKQTELGKIPNDWEIRKLEEVADLSAGGTPSRFRNDYWENGIIPWVSSGEIRNNIINSSSEKITQLGLSQSAAKLFPKGTVLIAITGQGLTRGRTALLGIDATTNQSVVGVFCSKSIVNNIFLWYYLQNQYWNLRSISQGSNQAGLNLEILNSFRIMLPPILEQQKIASIFSKVDELIQKTDQIIEQSQRLKKGVMQRLLTKGIGHTKFKKVRMGFRYMVEEYPEEWKIIRLNEFCKVERGKFTHRPRDDPDYYGGGYPFIQTGDIERSNGYVQNFSQTLNEKGLSVSKLFPAGIIVITIAATIGSLAITTFPVCFPDSIVAISTSKVNLKFLYYYLSTRKTFLEICATVSAQPNINLETLRPLQILIPSIKEQEKIATILSNIDLNVEKQKIHRNKLALLKRGLMQKLLTGKIRVKV